MRETNEFLRVFEKGMKFAGVSLKFTIVYRYMECEKPLLLP
jgi:RNase P protein component